MQIVVVLQQIWLIGGMLLMCQNTTLRVYGAWIDETSPVCREGREDMWLGLVDWSGYI